MADYGHDLRFGTTWFAAAEDAHRIVELAVLAEQVGLDLGLRRALVGRVRLLAGGRLAALGVVLQPVAQHHEAAVAPDRLGSVYALDGRDTLGHGLSLGPRR